MPTWPNSEASGLVNRIMLVQIQSSALVSRWCNADTHQGPVLEGLGSWFESRSGC